MKLHITALAVLILGVTLYPQNFNNGFNFSLPFDDTAKSKFIPEFNNPVIDNQNFITINSSGNFSYKGERIRFWGGNLVAGGAFPNKTKSAGIAGRLKKLGFNLIRFHHMDNPWSNESLFEYGSDTRHLNPSTLDRLDFIISKLKANGIFANINLNVSRQFKKADGVPYADSLVEMAKGVTLFDPKLITLQQEFAVQLLNHVNPYTGLSLADDPVMAMLEIVNENSLYRIWRDNKTKLQSEGGYLTYYHNRMLDSLWNNFLFNKYQTTTALAAAWNNGLMPPGINLVRNGTFEAASINTDWRLEQNNGTASSIQKDVSQFYTGTASGKVTVTTATGTSWHIQFKQIGLTFSKDSAYTVEFAAKCSSTKNIEAGIMRDNSPYTFYGGSSFQLSTTWKIYRFTIKPSENITGFGRLTFQFPAVGDYWFDDVKIYNAKVDGLVAGESLELRNIKRTAFSESNSFTDKRVQDMSDFYISLQDKFYSDMKNFLKDFVGVKCPINGTNWNVGPGDLIVQSKLDYMDNHSYWDHPSFPGTPWSSTDWYINNTSMLKDVNGGTMPGLFGGIPFSGKPYTISEYNHPFPNRFQTEAPLVISTYSSFHNADGIMFFDYNSGASFENDFVSSFFSIDRNNAMMSLMPSCAYSFRKGFINKANQEITINYKRDDVLKLPKKDDGGWEGIKLFDKKLTLIHAVKTGSFDAAETTDFQTLPTVSGPVFKTDTDEITWNTTGILTAGSKYFSGAAGYINTIGNISAGNLTVITADNFGVITWIPTGGDSLSISKNSLLTISTKQQNANMIWDGTTTIHNNWGSSPTQLAPLNAYIKLNIYADSIYVYPLDNRGKETAGNFTVHYPVSPNTFTFNINQNINKTAWFGIEKFGSGTLTAVNDIKEIINNYSLEQNYPNPFNISTNFNYLLPCESDVTIDIFDILGNRIKTLVKDKIPAGKYSLSWNGQNDSGTTVTSGIYLLKLSTPVYSGVKKLVLLK